MHSIILLTAMTASSGLFGGHHKAKMAGCRGGSCGRTAAVAYAPTCATGNCPTPSYAPSHTAYAPTPQYQAAPAVAYSSYYYPPSSCATGNCPRR